MSASGWSRGEWSALLVSALAVVLVIVWPAYLPTVDGPQQVYGAYLFKNYHALKSWYEPGAPLGAAGFPLLFFPVAAVLPWEQAHRLALGLIAFGWWGGAVALARVLPPARWWLAAVGATLVFQWSLYMGFFSFLLGTSLGVFALAEALSSRRRSWLVALLLTLASSGHLFSGALALIAVGAVGVAAEETWRARLLLLLRQMAAPVLFLCAVTLVSRSGLLLAGEAETLPLDDRLLAMARMGTGGPLWRCGPPLLVALVASVLAILRRQRGEGTARELGLALVVLGFSGASLLSPLHLPGWMYFAPRFLPVATLVGLLLLPIEEFPAIAQRVGQGVLGLWAVASLLWTASYHHHLESAAAPLLEVARAPVRQDGPRLPVLSRDPLFEGVGSMDQLFPYADPLFNLPLVAASFQGGVLPYSFTNNRWIHPFVTRQEHPPFPAIPQRHRFWLGLVDPEVRKQPALRGALLTDLALYGASYQDVLLFGSGEDQEVFLRLGYEPRWRSENGLIGAFRGCPARLTVERPAEAPRTLSVFLGWLPLRQPASEQKIEANEETLTVGLTRVPCGPVWIDVATDDSAWHCEGAQQDGRLLFLQRKGEQDLSCRLRKAAANAR